MAMLMYHVTRDGDYVDGILVDQANWSIADMHKVVATYEGCHLWWRARDGDWYSIPTAGIAYARWEPELLNSVPEIVRTAEIMR
jgi:hypothetical protein